MVKEKKEKSDAEALLSAVKVYIVNKMYQQMTIICICWTKKSVILFSLTCPFLFSVKLVYFSPVKHCLVLALECATTAQALTSLSPAMLGISSLCERTGGYKYFQNQLPVSRNGYPFPKQSTACGQAVVNITKYIKNSWQYGSIPFINTAVERKKLPNVTSGLSEKFESVQTFFIRARFLYRTMDFGTI